MKQDGRVTVQAMEGRSKVFGEGIEFRREVVRGGIDGVGIPPPMSKMRTFLVPTTSRPYAIAAAVDSTIKCTLGRERGREGRREGCKRRKRTKGPREI
jgi:hypothetical protein